MFKLLRIILVSVIVSMTMASCSSLVHDDLSNCPTRLTLDMQPLYAARNVFASEVNDAHIYIHKGEDCVRELTIGQDELKGNEYKVDVDLPAGEYSVVVWSGTTDTQNYDLRDASVQLLCQDNVNDRCLTPLWHGTIQSVAVDDYQVTEATVPMVEDTNTVVVLVHDDSDENLDQDTFSYEITARNGSLAPDNSLSGDELIHYKHYATSSEEIEGAINPDSDELGQLHVLCGELNTLRLLSDNPAYLYIKDNTTDRVALAINLTQYILLARSHQSTVDGSRLSDQEYLDSEHEYNLTFYLSRTGDISNPYSCAMIIINGWAIRMSDANL